MPRLMVRIYNVLPSHVIEWQWCGTFKNHFHRIVIIYHLIKCLVASFTIQTIILFYWKWLTMNFTSRQMMIWPGILLWSLSMLTGPEKFRPGIPGFAEFADEISHHLWRISHVMWHTCHIMCAPILALDDAQSNQHSRRRMKPFLLTFHLRHFYLQKHCNFCSFFPLLRYFWLNY